MNTTQADTYVCEKKSTFWCACLTKILFYAYTTGNYVRTSSKLTCDHDRSPLHFVFDIRQTNHRIMLASSTYSMLMFGRTLSTPNILLTRGGYLCRRISDWANKLSSLMPALSLTRKSNQIWISSLLCMYCSVILGFREEPSIASIASFTAIPHWRYTKHLSADSSTALTITDDASELHELLNVPCSYESLLAILRRFTPPLAFERRLINVVCNPVQLLIISLTFRLSETSRMQLHSYAAELFQLRSTHTYVSEVTKHWYVPTLVGTLTSSVFFQVSSCLTLDILEISWFTGPVMLVKFLEAGTPASSLKYQSDILSLLCSDDRITGHKKRQV